MYDLKGALDKIRKTEDKIRETVNHNLDLITFDVDTCKEFATEYNKALKEEKEVFTFKGYDLVTSFAKYQLEFLHTIFKF